MAVSHTNLKAYLPLVASGKVRELYSLADDTLLFVATDRISAYDVIMTNGVDQKGAILTQLSAFWFRLLMNKLSSLRTHFISAEIPPEVRQKVPADSLKQLEKRSMVVRKLKVIPIESIVRGYITGSAWSSYQKTGSFCDIPLPKGLQESQKLEHPLWTLSTKAEAGESDENISPDTAARLIGKDIAAQVEKLSLQIYTEAHEYAISKGIILADTKFEFALDNSVTPPAVVLVDEVLTPDSSRFWSLDGYKVGQGQASFDKQYLRDWLVQTGQKGKQGVAMPEEVVTATIDRYKEAYARLTGAQWNAE